MAFPHHHPIQHNTTAGAAAVQIGLEQHGLSLGGAGFLIFYYIGIVEVLSKLGVITHSTKLAGSSSGALITASHCAGVPTDHVYKAAVDMAHSCRSHMSCSGTLDKELRKVLESTLPPDAAQRCSDKGYIAITTGRLLANEHHPMIVSDFKDREELVGAAACSSFIPMWSAGHLATRFRGLQVYDGGFASHQPCPPGVKRCIKISTSNPAWAKRTGVETFMARILAKGPQAIMAPDPTVRKFPAITPTGSDGGPDPAMVQLAAEKGVDIAPGVYNHLPLTQQEWNEYALTPGDDGTLEFMFQLGKADAAAWAKHSGYGSVSSSSTSAEKGGGSKPGGRRLQTAGGL